MAKKAPNLSVGLVPPKNFKVYLFEDLDPNHPVPSVLTERLKRQKVPNRYLEFRNEDELKNAILDAVTEIVRQSIERPMLVISAHGRRGTHWPRLSMRWEEISILLQPLPHGSIVYLSECEGGFQAPMNAISKSNKSLIVAGFLIEDSGTHFNQVQNLIMEWRIKSAELNDLICIVSDWNRKQNGNATSSRRMKANRVSAVCRVRLPSGKMIPPGPKRVIRNDN